MSVLHISIFLPASAGSSIEDVSGLDEFVVFVEVGPKIEPERSSYLDLTVFWGAEFEFKVRLV